MKTPPKNWIWAAFAWLGIPLCFAVFAKGTYVFLVDGTAFHGFYPNSGYWVITILALVGLGASAVRGSKPTRPLIVIPIYCVVMLAILLLLQGFVSCFSGDCI